MTFQTSHRQKRSGFTLVELLLVVAIIAILSALGLSVLSGAEQDALESRTRAGIERIANVLNKKLEVAQYRILPVRLPDQYDYDGDSMLEPTGPWHVRQFRAELMPEFLRVEFPFLSAQIDPNEIFPQNQGPMNYMPPPTVGAVTLNSLVSEFTGTNDRPQISRRYDGFFPPAWYAKSEPGGGQPDVKSAECLYAILSLNFDEFGQSLVSILREREIGDTDGDGVLEVLDAFGDPLQFSLRVRLDETEIEDMVAIGSTEIMRDPLSDIIGYEAILDQTQTLQPGQVRGPRPLQEYRLSIRSVNLFNTASGAVVTQ